MPQTRFKGSVTGLALWGLLASGSAGAQLLTLHAEGTVDLLLAIQFQHFQVGDPISLDIVFDGSRTATGSVGNERLFANAVTSISVKVADYTASGGGTLSLFDEQPIPLYGGPSEIMDTFSIRSDVGTGLSGAAVDGFPLEGLQFDLGFTELDPAWFTSDTLPLGDLPFADQQEIAFVLSFVGPFDVRIVGSTTFSAFTVTPVPVPAAAWLLGSGVLGMAGWRRRSTAAPQIAANDGSRASREAQ